MNSQRNQPEWLVITQDHCEFLDLWVATRKRYQELSISALKNRLKIAIESCMLDFGLAACAMDITALNKMPCNMSHKSGIG